MSHPPTENPFALRPQLERAEREAIAKALRASRKRRHTARLLGISVRALLYKLKRYGLREPLARAGNELP